jgi:pimeloyl-ACP methyl ester carboxylesterase
VRLTSRGRHDGDRRSDIEERKEAAVGAYVAINELPTWIEDQGTGSPVLLLHGGLSNSDEMLASFGTLADRFRLVAFDRRGHGRTADTAAAFHYADMTDEAIGVLETVVGEATDLVGYSDGANVALLVALRRPDLVRSLVLIGANYRSDGLMPGVFDDFDPESDVAALLVTAYAERSPDGAEHFPAVMEKTTAMFAAEPTMTEADLARVGAPALVLVGDDDIATLAHTCSLYESLPAGQLGVIPAASHLVVFEKPELVNALVTEFLTSQGPPQTLMPVRRSHSPAG